ncbi:MAG: chemotaxis response regulator protein-glutamate methylesterase [Proteobacteria bacterium]|nr:chemotaxis response regulator protein-glutamate methylesterase [Desulfobacteraceae bacterium]MBU4101199.1 chemotaxis response regulator protein-glutamate methylesterase [Pseudomonadota bacterium]
MKPIRVLIVEDSPVVQTILKRILSSRPDIVVMGVASDAFEAKKWIMRDIPDVITLDIEMPRMDGITFLKRLMSYRPIPVIMISSYTHKNSLRTMEALEAGAVDFVTKPSQDVEKGLAELRDEIIAKVRTAAQSRVKADLLKHKPELKAEKEYYKVSSKLIAIGASTGGPQVIQKLLSGFFFQTKGIVIAQHMAAQYTKAFAERLNSLFPFEVREACDMDRIDQGKVLIAPGGKHIRVVREGNGYFIKTVEASNTRQQCPSADILFHSVAESAGPNAVGIILTGMGEDGADGILAMKKAGAYTIAQDEASCVVFGMPNAAIKRGGIDVVASPDDIPVLVLAKVKKQQI